MFENTRGTVFTSLVEAKLLELVLGAREPASANERLEEAIRALEEQSAQAGSTLRAAGESEEDWVGVYRTESGLDFEIRAEDGTLILDEGTWQASLGVAEGDDENVLTATSLLPGLKLRREDGAIVLREAQFEYRFVRQARGDSGGN